MDERELEQAEAATRTGAQKVREGAGHVRKVSAVGPWSDGAEKLDRVADELDKTADTLRREREKLKREKPKPDKPK